MQIVCQQRKNNSDILEATMEYRGYKLNWTFNEKNGSFKGAIEGTSVFLVGDTLYALYQSFVRRIDNHPKLPKSRSIRWARTR